MSTVELRNNVRELLLLLSSEKDQLTYESDVPHVDITVELMCMWFDDSYHPNSEVFRACFSQDELEVLEYFNAKYRKLSALLPESKGTVKSWLNSPVWREVMSEAAIALTKIAA